MLVLEHELIESIESGLPCHEAPCCGDCSVHEDLAARRPVGKAELLVRAEEVHLVRSGDGAAAQAVHADLSPGTCADHALAAVGDIGLVSGIDGI